MQVADILAVRHPGRVMPATLGPPALHESLREIDMIHSYLPWHHPTEWRLRPWLQDVDRAVTYGEGAEWTERIAAQLTRAGVTAGDVVAVMLANRVELPIVTMAAWRIGASVTPVNPALKTAEALYQIGDAAAKLVVHDKIDADLSGQPTLHVDDLVSPNDAPLDARLPPIPPAPGSHTALLVYTSGSTGRPKGVILTHDNLLAMASTLSAHLEITPDDHCLLVLPLFHVNAICVSFLTPTYSGARLTILRRFEARPFTEARRTYAPTYFSAVPTLLARIMELPEEATAGITSLRFVLCGAAPVSPDLLARVEALLGVPLVEGYGLTEGTCATCSNPLHGVRKLGSVGPALPGQEVRVVDGNGDSVPVGRTGEVIIRGNTVMRGYLNKPDATASAVIDGWLHTGDVGRLDQDGYLTLVDRIKDLIIRGGENIYPKEIENALYEHPAVLEAAVVGRPDKDYGEVPIAFVVPYPGSELNEDTLRDHLRPSLAKFKTPARIQVVDTLPKNPVGKIDKPSLRAGLRTPMEPAATHHARPPVSRSEPSNNPSHPDHGDAVHKKTWCSVCEAACGLIATVKDGRLESLSPDPEHPASQGFACAKGLGFGAVLSDPDRVTTPLERQADGSFRPISWHAALAAIGQRLQGIIAEHGTKSVGLIEGNPVVHNYGAYLVVSGMAKALKTQHLYSAGSVDINNYFVANDLLYGSALCTPLPDFEHTDFALIVGANPVVSHGSMGTFGRVQDHLHDLIARGGRLVVVDPRRTETAKLGEHVAIRPGGDPWFLAALLRVIIGENLVDRTFLNEHTTGYDALRALVADLDMPRAAVESGVDLDTIHLLARGIARARTAAIYGRCGASLGQFSTLTKFLLDCLAVVTGNLDRRGGMVFSQPYFDAETLMKLMKGNGFDRWRTRVDNLPEVLDQAPFITLAREIQTPGEGQLRALISVMSNFVQTSPGPLADAVQQLDLFVALDPYINDSSRFADYILPPTLMLERDGFPLFSQLHATRPNVQWSDAVVAPRGESKPDWWILDQICRQIGVVPSPAPGAQLLGRLGLRIPPHITCDLAIRLGPQGDLFGLRRSGFSRRKLMKDGESHLYASSPRVGRLKKRIHTRDGKVHLAHTLIAEEMQRLGAAHDSGSDDGFPLRLFTIRELRSQNSWLHNVPKLMAGGRTCRLSIHPDDAEARNLPNGSQAEIVSPWGRTTATVNVTTDVMPGSVGMPAHWGHAADSGWRRARDAGGGRYNELVPADAASADRASGNAWLNGIHVEVRRPDRVGALAISSELEGGDIS
jgi:acyl-CoA synthetase (AMP-forming)/AMP-acid ligase II/anaerobic selenocysteine-containing dehydrogenase